MLLRKLRLVNYGGIYNGMHLYEINIDFTKCKNRIILIRGDNGSGKTTIEQALKPLPDSNDSFIAGKTAIKEIDYYDEMANIIYCLQFIHECKPNGERANAKGYIKKIIVATNEINELNPSGNITRCKEIIYEEFQLDPNYITLTQLSSTERGLADKRPADRKKYVNAIVNNTEVYNDIHKKLSKKSTTYKGLMGSIVSKLDSIGDKGKLDAELTSLNIKIKELSDLNTISIQKRASAEGAIREIDPDGSFIDKISTLYNNRDYILNIINDIKSKITRYEDKYIINDIDANSIYKLNKTIDRLEESKKLKQNEIESLLQAREVDATELQTKTAKLSSINSGMSYKQYLSIQSECKTRMSQIETRFKFIDLDNISQTEFVTVITNLTNIREEIRNYTQNTTHGIIDEVLNNRIDNVMSWINTTVDEIEQCKKDILYYESELKSIEAKSKIIEALKIRPDKCKINDCPYIKQAYEAQLELNKTNPDHLNETLKQTITHLKEKEIELKHYQEYKDASVFVKNCIDKLEMIKESLSKFKQFDINMIKDTTLLFKSMYLQDNHILTILDELYFLLDIANNIEEYKTINKEYNRVTAELKSLKSQADFIELLEKDIADIQSKLDKDIEIIDRARSEIKNIDRILIDYNNQLKDETDILEYKNNLKVECDSYNNIEKEIESEKNKIDKINKYRDIIDESNSIIQNTDIQLKPLLERREMINYQLNLMTQYIKELEEYKTMYNKIETLKYYSSPTTGIQLLFVSIYMNKILDNANRLLCNLFNGQFALLPFIITESEFRIPVAVNDGLNHEDITTMSSAQIALLSMIISISLLSQTSTKLNIIVGDEIDAPFDGTNRRQFFEILDKLRMLVNANQCVLISHNSELSQYACDVILLRNENSDDRSNSSGNIIWSYYNQ